MTTDRASPRSVVMSLVTGILVTVLAVSPLVLVGSGVWLLAQRQLGETVQAEVLSCQFGGTRRVPTQHCTARWTHEGVQRTGPIQASGDQEVGETITATVRGDELYSRSLALPLILLGLGLPFCFIPYVIVRDLVRRRRAPG